MHLGRNPSTTYTMENLESTVELTMTNSEKDLGLWITSLKPTLHCDKAAATANRILGMLKRSLTKLSRELFVFLHKTYVRQHLEYCIQLWYPYLACDIDKLEMCKGGPLNSSLNLLNYLMSQG